MTSFIISNTDTTSHTADSILEIYPPKSAIDPYAQTAFKETAKFYENNYPGAKAYSISQGNSGVIAQLSNRLNSGALEEVPRYLLSSPSIYAALIQIAILEDEVAKTDLEGLYSSVVRYVTDLPRRYFFAQILTQVLNDKRIRLKSGDKRWNRLDDLTLQRGLPIRMGQVEPAVMDILSTLYKEGNIPYYLEQYILNRTALAESSFTSPIRQLMTDYLVKLGVNIADDEKFQAGLYDEYFLLAYNEAIKLGTVTEDPIDTARIKGGEIIWDFSVDSFDTIEAQGIIPTNIRAAGALDYLYYIGEQMRVFDVVNALVLRWASGSLDVPEGKTASSLYRYHKLRDERSTPEERAMLYRRVLNKGNGRLLSNMVPNEDFPRLWHKLMYEVAEYIRKSEGSDSNWYDGKVSRAPIEQATKNLQYNLTDFMTGMSHLQVTEDYAHLQEAMEILKASEILSEFGGRRKSIWTVIEKVGKDDLGVSIPTVLLRTCAVEGNKIFQWIAGFNEYGSVRAGEFENFLDAAESWIIAQASLEGEEGTMPEGDYEEEDEGGFGAVRNEVMKDFNNFEDADDFEDDWDW